MSSSNSVVGSNCVPSSGVCGSGAGGGSGTGGGSGGGGGGGAACTDTWSSYARGFFSSYCTNCHGSEFASYSNVAGKAASIRSRISSGNMPPGGLSASQSAQILSWLDCGAKQ